MKQLIKYAAVAFAIFLSVMLIGGFMKATVMLLEAFTDAVGLLEADGQQTPFFTQNEDGSIVLCGVHIGGAKEGKNIDEVFEEEIHSLELWAGSAKLTVKTGERFEVHARNVSEDVTAEVTDGVLKLRGGSSGWFRLFAGLGEETIEVTVPERFTAERLEIDSGSGGSLVDGIAAKETRINSGSGRVEVTGASLGSLTIDSGSGSVELSEVSAEMMNADTGSGRLRYSGTLSGNVTIDSGSGSVALTISTREEDYNLAADIGSGGLYINGRRENRTKVRNDNARYSLWVNSGSGRVSIEFTGEE